jgi:hypothetical protein
MCDNNCGCCVEQESTVTLEATPMMQTVECSGCHKKMPFAEFLNQFPMPAEEICLTCEKLSQDGCDECRLEYFRSHPLSGFQCLSCRKSVVPC